MIVRAPSNIALIKYMGKKDPVLNLPENASVSMTLDRLSTWVEIDCESAAEFSVDWQSVLPLGGPADARIPQLSEAGLEKVRVHVQRVAKHYSDGIFKFILKSANTFPEASGIASSASSFAALTLAVAYAVANDREKFREKFLRSEKLRQELARLARRGSGSACRSLEGPFVYWEGEQASVLKTAALDLVHFVVLVSSEAKALSSSAAHARVKTSPLWQGRVERASQRLGRLQGALIAGDLDKVAREAWAESWEMHSLFHTASEPFSYWKPGSIEALQWFLPWIDRKNAPIVTMDAGPNLHVIVRATEADEWRTRLHSKFGKQCLLEDRPGKGAEIIT